MAQKDEFSLEYGGQVIKLQKSEKLVAIKPKPGKERELLSNAAPHGGLRDSLGGFQLVSVEESEVPADEVLDTLRAAAPVGTGTHVYHTPGDDAPFVPTGQIYVVYQDFASPDQCQKLLDEQKLQVIEARGERALITQVTPDSPNPLKVAAALQKSPLVKIAEPDLAVPGVLAAISLLDPLLPDQWHLRNTGMHRGTMIPFKKGADARVIDAWEETLSLGSATVVVAVIDDGFDLSHPDLSGDWKVTAPKDFTRNSTSPLPDPLAGDWHGTACAGVAIGNADGSGIVGAAPRSRLMPIRWRRELGDRDIEDWFGYVQQQGAWVVSCSWSASARNFPLSTRKSEAISRCAREGRTGLGCIICFAAGNENRDIDDPTNGSVNGFAIHPDVIAVAACNSRDEKSNYSNYGKAISVCAPSSGAGGYGITTADVTGRYGYSPGAYTHDFGGTSSACPLVGGICALLLSIEPTLKASDVKRIIQESARRIGDTEDYDANEHSVDFGFGCIDAVAAVKAVNAWSDANGSPALAENTEAHRSHKSRRAIGRDGQKLHQAKPSVSRDRKSKSS